MYYYVVVLPQCAKASIRLEGSKINMMAKTGDLLHNRERPAYSNLRDDGNWVSTKTILGQILERLQGFPAPETTIITKALN